VSTGIELGFAAPTSEAVVKEIVEALADGSFHTICFIDLRLSTVAPPLPSSSLKRVQSVAPPSSLSKRVKTGVNRKYDAYYVYHTHGKGEINVKLISDFEYCIELGMLGERIKLDRSGKKILDAISVISVRSENKASPISRP
jgi:hypothetical protein